MEYIGEHTLPGLAGRFFVSLALVSALISALAYYFSYTKKDKSYQKLARTSFLIHTGSIIGVVACLFYLMTSHYFEYDYVWKHSSLDLPGKYIFSAFWEGQEGSFILWMFWHVILGTLLMYTARKWEAPAMIVFALVQAFLASMILGVYLGDLKIGSSPFVLMRNTPENIGLPWTQVSDYLEKFPAFMDGSGLNPLLQNYWMTIHPPVLFLGFASTLAPFALAMAGLFTRDYGGWVKTALPWSFFSVMILGTGILMGGAWAYEALSFGGFWAWDPVENSSLVPWITMTGGAHLLLVYRNRKTGLHWSFFMVIVTFLLILYSTFLTRSGVLGDSSVHAFVDLGLSGQLLIYLLFFVILALGIFIYHFRKIPSAPKDDELSSKEFWMFIGSLVLLISAFQIIFSTSIPVINKVFGPEGILSLSDKKLAPPLEPIKHYNSFQIPFAIVIALLIGIAQWLNYKHTKGKTFFKRMLRSLVISLLLTLGVSYWFEFWQEPLYLILLFASLFAIITNIDYWLILGKGKMSFTGSSIAHIGFGLIIAGALISNAKQKIISRSDVFLSEDMPSNEHALMELSDSTRLGNYVAVFNGMRDEGGKQFYDVTYYSRQDSNSTLKEEFRLSPFLQMSDNMGPTPNPSTAHFWNRDIYTHVTYSSYLEPETDDGYRSEMEVDLSRGDTAIYQDHFVIMDSLRIKASYTEDTRELAKLRLTAKLRVVNVFGEEFWAEPVYVLEGNTLSFEDAFLDDQKFKFRLEDINTTTNKIVLKAWTQAKKDEKPFIVMKAIVFPMINLLWIGCILMAIGSGIAVWQRVKNR
ncbi:MAG: cytochrome C biogenesis protein [Owenweeksia sp.]|nr:cytochrome C biogenesis protein [Owenweeksia sp.]